MLKAPKSPKEMECTLVVSSKGEVFPPAKSAKGIHIHYHKIEGGGFTLQATDGRLFSGKIDPEEYIFPVRLEDDTEWIEINNRYPNLYDEIRECAEKVDRIQRKWWNYSRDVWDFTKSQNMELGLQHYWTDFKDNEMEALYRGCIEKECE